MKKQLPARMKIITILLFALLPVACVQQHPDNLSPSSSRSGDLPAEPILRIENGMHTAAISSISADAGNRFLLTTSFDKTARIWNFATGKLLSTLRVPSGYGLVGRLECGAISPDGKTIAVGGWTGPVPGKKQVYIFDRTNGKIIQRLSGIPAVILHLAFSKDGSSLAATTGREGGLYVWDTKNWVQRYQDLEYQEETHWVDFDKIGRLVTASYDGFVRLYDTNFRLITMRGIAGGLEPSSVVFSPDGRLVAVGFNDSTKINILSGTDLSYLYTPDTGKIGKGSLGAVAWSAKNNSLYGGGRRNENNQWQLLKWSAKGKKYSERLAIDISDTVIALQPVSHGRLVFASHDPAFGVLNSDGHPIWLRRATNADFSGPPDGLRLSANGGTVQLSIDGKRRKDITFSLTAKGAKVWAGKASSVHISAPRTRLEQLSLSGWQHQNYRHYTVPRVNGKPISLEKFESSWSAAIRPGGQGFVLGTDRFIRAYDAQGVLLWRCPVQTAWAVNISGNGDLVVAALRDGTIRWYDWENGRELMALFLQNKGKDWVAWTPEGFFDHSPGGEKIIGFQVNKGWSQAPDFISIEQMYNSLYRPDLFVADFLGNDQQYRVAARKIDLNKVIRSGLPPRVKIELPVTRTKKKVIRAKVYLTPGDGGLGRVVYRVNGITRLEENQQQTASGQENLTIEKELPLEPGKNIIAVTAYNGSNEIESRPALATVYRKITAGERSGKPALYVLAIGVNKYKDHALELHYPVEDARAFANTLRQSGEKLFRKIPVKFLLDDEVTEQNMEKMFHTLAAEIQPDDVFVLYIAGHGLAMESNYYFLPWDLLYKNEQSVAKEGISREDLQRFLAMIPANKAVILLDTCNAGAFAGVSTRGLNEKTAISKLIRATGRATIMASTDTQAAYEGYKGHGVFTWTLIEALKGEADRRGNKDGIITINELAEFVMEEVPKITLKQWKYEQFPLQDLTGRSFPIGMTNK